MAHILKTKNGGSLASTSALSFTVAHMFPLLIFPLVVILQFPALKSLSDILCLCLTICIVQGVQENLWFFTILQPNGS